MAIALVNHVTKSVATGGATTSAVDMTGANLIVIGRSMFSTTGTISDSQSNTYTDLTQYNSGLSGSRSIRMAYCLNPSVSSSMTFSTAAGQNMSVYVAGFSGVGSFQAAADVGHWTGTSGDTTVQPGSLTPSNSGALLIGCTYDNNATTNTSPWSADSGFTVLDKNNANGSIGINSCLFYLIQGAAAAANPTLTNVQAGNLGACMAAFLAASSGAIILPPMLLESGMAH